MLFSANWLVSLQGLPGRNEQPVWPLPPVWGGLSFMVLSSVRHSVTVLEHSLVCSVIWCSPLLGIRMPQGYHYLGDPLLKNPPGLMQGTWVGSLVREDSTCCRAAKPVCHSCWVGSLEPKFWNKRSHCNKKPVHTAREWPPPATIRESLHTAMKTQSSQRQVSKYRVKKRCHWVHSSSPVFNSSGAVRFQKHLNSVSSGKWETLASPNSYLKKQISSVVAKLPP